DPLVGAVVAEILAQLGGGADGDVGELDLGIGVVAAGRAGVVGVGLLVEADRAAAAEGQSGAVEVVGELRGDREVLGVLFVVVAEPGAGARQDIARVLGIVGREGGGELEAGEGRAEIDELGRAAVDAVAGAVGAGIA